MLICWLAVCGRVTTSNKNSIMKKVFFSVCIASTSLLVCCNDNKKSDTTVSTDTTSTMLHDTAAPSSAMNSSAGDTSSSAKNSSTPVTAADVTDFVKKASSGGMMEVEAGKLAQQNAQNDRVKAFGAMMVNDHTAAGNELKSMAQSNSIMVPTALLPEHQMHLDMLKGKTGAAFDKAYMDMMLNDHKKDVADYKKASTSLSVDSYKAFAAKTLPTLQIHLDSAQAINKKM